ncbi:MAG: ABC transporter substrate-binding protein [Proteobacteria bacterium]|nr:ABC transporter substrate-binding protein [Pseudomonadota bacterium]MBU1231627.1 ABC transporter substrate-binding protein [Pseudomonadota bacterium]MBU1420601.1 ABC transporter substrate-binding protein [Pseudomonadota bacterium]MBU1455792.1 ABC transporter substrate-binding protein [Pseudomonadota bacterium]
MKTRCLLWSWQRILLIVFCVIFLQTGSASAIGKNTTEEPVLLRIGYLPVLSQLPLVISYDRQRLSYQKVRVELTGFKSYIALEAAFRLKAIDIAYLPIPTILRMNAEGIDLLMGDSLHRGGSSLVMDPSVKEKKGSGTIYGIPGLVSSELLILHTFLSHAGLSYGDDFKVAAVQLDHAIDELEQGYIDGLFLPEPYPTMASWQLPEKVQSIQLDAEAVETVQAALVFNHNVVASSNDAGLLEWLDSVEGACRFLEQDIQDYGGAQTILTQQNYFGFEPALIRQAFSNLQSSLEFSSQEVPLSVLDGVIEKMIALKLLQESVNVKDMLLDKHILR